MGGAFAFFLFTMLYNLMHSALWGDEWVEYTYSQEAIGTGALYERIISTFQPPLYNYVMHFWLKVNSSIEWFRFFNVLLGGIAGVFLFLTVKRMYSRKTAAIALCGLAVCYQWVYCIQECSEYALMLFFLFAALYFFVEARYQFTYWKMIFLILACVGAVYSQYGSAFVVLPLLLLFYLGNLLEKGVRLSRKLWISASYLISVFAFAAPLYFSFLQKQLERNEIANHAMDFSLGILKDAPFTLGHIIGYFFSFEAQAAWKWVWGLVSVLLLLATVLLFIKGQLDWTKKFLIITLWFAYALHYLLVQLHIYAMVHPNQSSGFFCRYSYFYIPLFCVILPMVISELCALNLQWNIRKGLTLAAGAGVLCMFLSFHSLLGNWNKTYDDQFAEIWMEEKGWEDTTYLLGLAHYGFEYYVSHADGYQEGYLNRATQTVDVNNLAPRFWVWRTNWGANQDSFQTIIDKAAALGYHVKIYRDCETKGQLAFCSLSDESGGKQLK